MDNSPGTVGASVERLEDERYLRGLGRFVGDIALSGMREVSFVRSTMPHAVINKISWPEKHNDNVFTAADLGDIEPIVADSSLPNFKSAAFSALAEDKVRYCGECIAMCLANSRAEAEDVANEVEVDYQSLQPVNGIGEALANESQVHESWGDNLNHFSEIGDTLNIDAPIVVERRFTTARHCMVPMECRGVVADWNEGKRLLTVYTSTQVPHLIRRALANCLKLRQQQVRVIAPDVGGGFGLKLVLQPEEVAVSWLAMRLRQPVRWIEDRKEHLIAGANAREHVYKVRAFADNDGGILGLDVAIDVNAGAYSAWPFTSCFEAAQAGASFPGPYKIPAYHAETRTLMSNKPPLQPYRGVSRTGICFALELTIDAVAREAGLEPAEVRKRNLVTAEEMPYTNVVGKIFDSGDYRASVERAEILIDLPSVRRKQAQRQSGPSRIGVGFGTYTEQTAHGTKVFAGVGIPIVPGHEQARVRLTPDGTLEVMTGLQSHGQSLETTLAQIASEALQIPLSDITVIHGDTGETPFSTGTYASRSIVWGGGAVDDGCQQLAIRLRRIGAALLNASFDDTKLDNGKLCAPEGAIDIADLAAVWYDAPEELDVALTNEPLEAVGSYKPKSDHGAFSYATHAAVVDVDIELGAVKLLDYVIVDDCGKRVNPKVVEGQIIGGTAQGIGTALYEESSYDSNAIPLNTLFSGYRIPSAQEIPELRIETSESPSPRTAYGIKGVGEGGAVAPPAAIINAINDALGPLGCEITETPATPERIYAAIKQASA
ncbi:MAG: xanthine dehydrogenase family protein molybdopterin-binding subunit [Pseudomonadota bacterium]